MRSFEKVISDGPVRKKNRKTSERSNGVSVVRKNSVAEKERVNETVDKSNRKEREETNYKKNRGTEKNVARKKKPLKISAVIITTKNNQVSYSEVLRWARQNVKLTDKETWAMSTKRSAQEVSSF